MEKSYKLGKYEVISKIGEGAYGAVYKAKNPANSEIVALKVSSLEREDQGIPSTTLREISILKGLSHPNIVRLMGVHYCKEKKGDSIQLVFEYVDEDLGKFIRRNKGLPEIQFKVLIKRFQKIFIQIIRGVKYLHDRNVYHRDLKPQNILIGKDGTVKIADFGLSRVIYDPTRTFSKQIETLWYRSPELLMGTKYYGKQIDIWSLGCILYELAQGTVLFKGDSQIGEIFKIFEILGTPKLQDWPEVTSLPYFKPTYPKMEFTKMNLKNLSNIGCDLLYQLLKPNPNHRITIDQVITHQFLQDI